MLAPHFSGPLLTGTGDFDLADHTGSYVVVGFMGIPWCGPCMFELPELQLVADEYSALATNPSVVFVVVNFPGSFENQGYIDFAEENDITIPAILYTNTIHADYAIGGFPTTMVIDREGEIVATESGAMSAPGIQEFIEGAGAPAPGAGGDLSTDLDIVFPGDAIDLGEMLMAQWIGLLKPLLGSNGPWPGPDPHQRRLAEAMVMVDRARRIPGQRGRAVGTAALAVAEEQIAAMRRRDRLETALIKEFGSARPYSAIDIKTKERAAKKTAATKRSKGSKGSKGSKKK